MILLYVIPSTKQKSILSLFFPTQVSMTFYDHLYKLGLFRMLRDLMVYKLQYKHFLYDDYSEKTVRKWCTNDSKIFFKESTSSFSIRFYFEYLSSEILEDSHFYINDKEIMATSIRTALKRNFVTFHFKKSIQSNDVLSFKIPCKMFANKMAITCFTIHKPKYYLFNILKYFVSRLEMRISGGFSFSSYANISKYSDIFVISKFSQKWLKKYWNLPSKLLYPPVSVSSFQPNAKKKNQIVHVGRFFTDGHNKKQLELAQEFIKMCEFGLTDWELHFIGSIANGQKHEEYFEKIKQLAKKYPITFHINIPFSSLKKILSQSKIYWHATGLDVDEESLPIKLEHFGITTVEAMASGCVPVVINKGGQSEIITKESGFLWNTRSDLQKYTFHLVNNHQVLEKMSLAAVKRSQFFSKTKFKEKLSLLLDTETR